VTADQEGIAPVAKDSAGSEQHQLQFSWVNDSAFAKRSQCVFDTPHVAAGLEQVSSTPELEIYEPGP